MPHPHRARVFASLLTGLVLLALHAGCGKDKPKSAKGRPEEVANAFFEALKADSLAPLEPFLMTAQEKQAITKMDSSDFEEAERDRWRSFIAQHHERPDLDWPSLEIASTRSALDAFGQGARVRLVLTSKDGSATVDVKVGKVGRRFVFDGVKFVESQKQAAPADPEEDDG